MSGVGSGARGFLGFTRYQWLVLFAAWLGWGFDVFDALLFNYVARLCIPSLLGPGTTPQEVTFWTGALTSVLLIGWAVGGIVFGRITDRLGRTRTLLVTMLTYALATAACAAAPNLPVLVLFRFVASLGIGGEWAAGAALVAETVPEHKRVQAGALLYTAAPAGLFLATFVTDLFTRQLDVLAGNPDLAWRAVFLTGLVPAAAAIAIRLKVRESEAWTPHEEHVPLRALFSPELRHRTIGGLGLAAAALVTWWTCNAFIPTIVTFLATEAEAAARGVDVGTLRALYTTRATAWFNLGGLLGTLLTVPIALHLGRRPMFLAYFAASAVAIALAFGADLPPDARLVLMFAVGLPVFGIFGSFTFYLPELFPTRLRGTGSGFCYNTGRFVTALGPFLVGGIAQRAQTADEILAILAWVAVVPAAAIAFMLAGFGEETRGRGLG
jgi:MFS family permease